MKTDNWIKEVWNELGDQTRRSVEGPPVREILDEIEIDPEGIIVELGAGDGQLTIELARRLEAGGGGGVLFALDQSKRLVDALDERLIALDLEDHVRALSLEHLGDDWLPINDGVVDTVVCTNTVQYLEEPILMWREVQRVLKPGGTVVVVDWVRSGLRSGSVPVRPASSDSVKRDLITAGLKLPETVAEGPSYWVVAAEKNERVRHLVTALGDTLPGSA